MVKQKPLNKSKIRILEVIQPTTGGSALHVRQLADHLNDDLNEIEIASVAGDSFEEYVRSRGVLFHPVSFRRSMNPIRDIRPFFELFFLVCKRKYDVVHLHSSKAGIIGRISARLAGVPVIYTPHSFLYAQMPAGSMSRKLMYGVERATLPLVDRIICVSQSEQDAAVADGLFAADKGVVVANGLPEASPASRKPKKMSNGPVILMPARLEWQKRPEDLIEAAAIIKSTVSNFSIYLAGSGSRQTELEQLAARLGVLSHVKFLGHIENMDTYYANATAVALCSNSEGMPYALLEGMRAGKPLIGTDIKGISDLIVDGENGYLYQLGEASDLAAKLSIVLKDEALTKRMGQASRRMFVKSYGVKQMIDSVRRIYASYSSRDA